MTSAPPDDILRSSIALLSARRPQDALNLLLPHLAQRPDDPRLLARAAYAYALLGRLDAALAGARRAAADDGAEPETLDLAGNALVLAHQPREAHALFARSVRLAPNPGALFNLAASARFIGETAEAEAAYDQLLKLRPDVWDAYHNRSLLRRQTPAANHVAELQRLLATPALPAFGDVKLAYALGKELEDLDRYDEAFAAYARGAAVRRRHMNYDVQADLETMAAIAEAFDATYCAPARDEPSPPGPIFILGLPRTGSTLLEQMLGRHSQVEALGELQAFGAALMEVLARNDPIRRPRPEMIRASARQPPAEVGQAYLDRVGPLRSAKPVFIDKLPFNALYAGAIARALPAARIVHLRRGAADTCLAIFKTLFDEAYPYSYDLTELGAYYIAHRRLMDHWAAALGPRLIEVDYERLVTDPEVTLTELMPRLGLALEPACLRPEASNAPSMTASASQVRSAIHARSVNLSDRYAQQLQPLLATLQAAGIDD